MAGVTFIHPNPEVGNLYLRLPPTNVEWTYNLNTQATDTIGGQVVQLLSINYEKLIIEGQFGKEGPHGARRTRTAEGRRIRERSTDEYFNLSERGTAGTQIDSKDYRIGLSQMTAYFRKYFAHAAQGGERDITLPHGYERGRFDQRWMIVRYSGSIDSAERQWRVYPTGFPSYQRSNENFAPKWRVEFEVVEPDFAIQKGHMTQEIQRLNDIQFGYRPMNPFSDPLAIGFYPEGIDSMNERQRLAAVRQAEVALDALNRDVLDKFRDYLPAYTPDELRELIFMDASMPSIYNDILKKYQSQKKGTPPPAQRRRTPTGFTGHTL